MLEYGDLSSKSLKRNIRFEVSTFEIRYIRNFVKTRKNTFWCKIPKCGDLSSKVWKSNVRFEISTFEIGHRQNFDKITKLVPFGTKYPNMENWARNFQKRMSDLKSTPSK